MQAMDFTKGDRNLLLVQTNFNVNSYFKANTNPPIHEYITMIEATPLQDSYLQLRYQVIG